MKQILLPLATLALLIPSPATAQANATSELMTYGDVLGGTGTATLSGVAPNTFCYILPSFLNTGSNYLVGLSGDPADILAVGVDLATGGTYFSGNSNASGEFSAPYAIPPLPSLLDADVWFQGFSMPGGVGAAMFDDFSNIRWINLNDHARWQSAGSSLPVASANVSSGVLARGPTGLPTRVFAAGGGPALMTNVLTPYPCNSEAWVYDCTDGSTTLLNATLNVSRAFHSTTVLQDGRVLLSGGVSYGGQKPGGNYFTVILDSAELWDPVTDTFTLLPPMSTVRAGHTSSLLPDGRVLVTGGTRGNGSNELLDVSDLLGTSLNSTEIFDPATLTWSAGPNLSEPKAGHDSITLLDGRVLIAGGITHTSLFGIPFPDFSSQASIYDPSTGSFSNAGNIGSKRALFDMALIPDGRVVVVSGAGGDILNIGPIRAVHLYDPATTSSSALTFLPSDAAFCTALSLSNGNVMVVGGAGGNLDDPIPTNLCYEINAIANTVTSLTPMGVDHAGGVAALMEDGTVYVGGGESNSGVATAVAESYSF